LEESTALDIVPVEDLRWEGTRDPVFDPLLAHWLEIAATAWEGYRTRGRGVVVTTFAGGRIVDIGYYPGSPCDCHAELVALYEPSEQAIVVVHNFGPEPDCLLPLVGWPSPREAWEITSAKLLRATVQ
jgi:hypothetical protein